MEISQGKTNTTGSRSPVKTKANLTRQRADQEAARGGKAEEGGRTQAQLSSRLSWDSTRWPTLLTQGRVRTEAHYDRKILASGGSPQTCMSVKIYLKERERGRK